MLKSKCWSLERPDFHHGQSFNSSPPWTRRSRELKRRLRAIIKISSPFYKYYSCYTPPIYSCYINQNRCRRSKLVRPIIIFYIYQTNINHIEVHSELYCISTMVLNQSDESLIISHHNEFFLGVTVQQIQLHIWTDRLFIIIRQQLVG